MIRSQGWLALLTGLLLTGCNAFSPLSSPSGDAQLLSAARAAFDQGNYQQAINYYGQLSSSNSDTGLAESAYAEMTEAGASMQAYAGAFGKGDVAIGPAITAFAESMVPGSQAKRVAIWQAYNQAASIGDANLKYLVKFLGSVSFAAEILAESVPPNSTTLTQNDLSNIQISATNFPTTADSHGDYTLSTAVLSDVNVATPTYNMFNAAVFDLINDVDQLGDNGTFGANTLSFASQVTSNFHPTPTLTSVYIALLVSVGIGTTQ